MVTSSVEIRNLRPIEAEEVAALHYLVFKDFFLTSFGKGFLKIFYRAILSHELGIGVGIFVDHNLAGFAIGTRNNTGFYKSLIFRKGLSLGLASLPNLILSPQKINRLLTPFLATTDSQYDNLPALLSICVSPDRGANGFGKKLLQEFEVVLRKNQCESVLLTTDSKNNEYVNKFYRNSNYLCVRSFLQGKREMNLYYKKLANSDGSEAKME